MEAISTLLALCEEKPMVTNSSKIIFCSVLIKMSWQENFVHVIQLLTCWWPEIAVIFIGYEFWSKLFLQWVLGFSTKIWFEQFSLFSPFREISVMPFCWRILEWHLLWIFLIWGQVTYLCFSKLGHHWFTEWLGTFLAPSHYLSQCWHIVNWTVWNWNQF